MIRRRVAGDCKKAVAAESVITRRRIDNQGPRAGGGPASAAGQNAASAFPQRIRLTCMATHPDKPCIVTGVGDGQIAIYHLYRAHGERRPQLHQTVGFDASRRAGDVATALHVPAEPLASEGILGQEAVIAGFESGRVAVFQLRPVGVSESKSSTSNRSSLDDEILSGEREPSGSQVSNLQPVMLVKEPLLLEVQEYCRKAVADVLWHPTLGIFSITVEGSVHVSDTLGAPTWSIPMAAGSCSLVRSADLSVKREELASNGVHLWQCLSQTQAGYSIHPKSDLQCF